MDSSQRTQLRQLVEILKRRWGILALVAIATGLSAFLVSIRMTPMYQAETRLEVQPTATDASQNSSLANLFVDPTIALQTDAELIQSDSVLASAANTLGLPSSAALRGSISVQLVPSTQILSIRASSASPAQARDYANAAAQAFITFQRDRAIQSVAVTSEDISRRIKDLQAQISAASVGSASSTVVDALNSQVGALESALHGLPGATALAQGGGTVIVPATTPSVPISPRTRRNVALGVVLGLMLGGGLVLLAEAMDDRVRSAEEVEERTGTPGLGSIPVDKKLAGPDRPLAIVHESNSAVAEAYRTLRTNVRFLSVERPLRTILVTSSSIGEGKSTTAANLAAAFALGGSKTVLVSADLRRPTAHKFFGLQNNIGLVDTLLPDVPLQSAVQSNELGDFLLLASGAVPPNPAEILSSARFADILATLEVAADIVIVDSPPLLGLADASAVASRVDGVLLVVNPHKVTRRALSEATQQLKKVGGRLLGTVLNAVGAEEGFGYDYQYYYATHPEGAAKASGELNVKVPPPAPSMSVGGDTPEERKSKVGSPRDEPTAGQEWSAWQRESMNGNPSTASADPKEGNGRRKRRGALESPTAVRPVNKR